MARFIIGLIFIILGISAFTGFDFGRYIGPLILITIGFLILRGPSRNSSSRKTEQDFLNEVLIFSGMQRSVMSKNFDGGKIVAVFGGADLDISKCDTKEKKINMELVSVFGGIKLRIPENWYVTSEAVGIIGGVDNKTSAKTRKIELHINGAAIFGGIELIN